MHDSQQNLTLMIHSCIGKFCGWVGFRNGIVQCLWLRSSVILLASAFLGEGDSSQASNHIGIVVLDLMSAHNKNLKREGKSNFQKFSQKREKNKPRNPQQTSPLVLGPELNPETITYKWTGIPLTQTELPAELGMGPAPSKSGTRAGGKGLES